MSSALVRSCDQAVNIASTAALRLDVHQAALRGCTPSATSSTIFAMKASRSSGLRLVMTPSSLTTGLSTHVAPALVMSVFKDGQDVILRPLAAPASINSQGPWQMAATGLRRRGKP